MFIHDPVFEANLEDYGILVPSKPDKIRLPLAYLKKRLAGLPPDTWLAPLERGLVSRGDLERVHDPEFVKRLYEGGETTREEVIRAFELRDERGHWYRYDPERAIIPLERLFDRELDTASGTLQACLTAAKTGFCFLFSGGRHHAQYGYGDGFCLINDVVIAADAFIRRQKAKRVWIIDVDAHKGDGTAALTANRRDIVTLSVHMGDSWPLTAERRAVPGHPSLVPSDIDIEINRGENGRYLTALAEGLKRLAAIPSPDSAGTRAPELAGSQAPELTGVPELADSHLPELAIVVDGSDPYEKDELPSTSGLRLTGDQMLERDVMVYEFLEKRGIPSAWLTAGGYGSASHEVYERFFGWLIDNGKVGLRGDAD